MRQNRRDRARYELLQRKRRHASQTIQHLRKRSATLSDMEIVEAVQRDRARSQK